jgi:hypothetical protein
LREPKPQNNGGQQIERLAREADIDKCKNHNRHDAGAGPQAALSFGNLRRELIGRLSNLAVVGPSLLNFGCACISPARPIERYREHRRERFLTSEELSRLGDALRQGETIGLPSEVDESKPSTAVARNLPDAFGSPPGPNIAFLLFSTCACRHTTSKRKQLALLAIP